MLGSLLGRDLCWGRWWSAAGKSSVSSNVIHAAYPVAHGYPHSFTDALAQIAEYRHDRQIPILEERVSLCAAPQAGRKHGVAQSSWMQLRRLGKR
jgi:hypothetical protein